MVVVFPYYPGDQELASKLSKWLVDLGPNKGHSALVVRDVRCNPNHDAEIKSNLSKVFDSVEAVDVVERLDSNWQASTKSAFGPNIMFRTAAKHIQYTNPVPWLWCEVDTVPLKGGWVQALANEYDQEPRKPFLMDFVQVPNVEPHGSGIGIYPGVITDYAGLAVMAEDTAWDVFAASQIVPQMKQTHLIVHRWHHPALKNQSEVDNLLGQLGDAVLFHSDKSGTLINFLREKKYQKPDGLVEPLAALQSECTGIVERPSPIQCDIFIKTCTKDYPWLEWCVHSIGVFAHGFRDAITIDDKDDKGNDGYLYQQVTKMYADLHSDADYILHLDSDTIFTRRVTPETYFKDGKPIIMITPIDQAHPDQENAWRRVMHKFMGKPSEYEYMRRFPIVYPSWAYKALREFCERQHGMALDKYIMAQPYREFTEFNVMGFFLWEFHRDKITWIDTSKIPESEWPELTVDQQWSHNPIPVEKWESILASGHGSVETTATTTSPDLEARSRTEPKPTSLTLKERRQAQAAKMRAAKAAKKQSLLHCSPEVAEMLKKEVIKNGSVTPWENKWESVGEINSLCQRLWKFCDAPMHTKRVRDELKKVGVIR